MIYPALRGTHDNLQYELVPSGSNAQGKMTCNMTASSRQAVRQRKGPTLDPPLSSVLSRISQCSLQSRKIRRGTKRPERPGRMSLGFAGPAGGSNQPRPGAWPTSAPRDVPPSTTSGMPEPNFWRGLKRERKSLLNLRRRTVNLRRLEGARDEGSTGPRRGFHACAAAACSDGEKKQLSGY